MLPEDDTIHEPLSAEAIEGVVLVRTPTTNHCLVVMTPGALLDSLEQLKQAAFEALEQEALRRGSGFGWIYRP